MGTNQLAKIAAAPTKVPATSAQYNAIVDAFQGHQIMRNSSGNAEDGAFDIGRPSSGRPRKIYVSSGINVAGQDIDVSSISRQVTGITGGLAKASGYPQFLEPGDETGTGGVHTVRILAASTPLEMTIDGQAYTLEADLESDDLALAPSTNNTATIHTVDGSGDADRTPYVGEFGQRIKLMSVGSEISSLASWSIHCFKVGTEVFISYLVSDGGDWYLQPIRRGIAGTNRSTISDGNTITLLKAHYIFLDTDLTTIDTSTIYPATGYYAPVSPAAGDYWKKSQDGKWYRYSGATWEALGRIYLGFAIASASEIDWVEHEDFDLDWNGMLEYELLAKKRGTYFTVAIKGPLFVSIAGTKLKIDGNIFLDLSDSSLRESAFSLVQNKWVYLYIGNQGDFHFSLICPRKKDNRLGMYHPSQYWRCIGIFYMFGDGTGVVDQIFAGYVPETGKLDLFGNYVGGIALGDSAVTLGCSTPPFLRDVDLLAQFQFNTAALSAQIELSNGGNALDFFSAFESNPFGGNADGSEKHHVRMVVAGLSNGDLLTSMVKFTYLTNRTFYVAWVGSEKCTSVVFYQIHGTIYFK